MQNCVTFGTTYLDACTVYIDMSDSEKNENGQLCVNCPTCKSSVVWTSKNPFRPFCSERCRLIDLGEWVEERRSISDGDTEASLTGGYKAD